MLQQWTVLRNNIQTFYNDLDQAKSSTKSHEVNATPGDFNANAKVKDVVEGYGLGMRNERGDKRNRMGRNTQHDDWKHI